MVIFAGNVHAMQPLRRTNSYPGESDCIHALISLCQEEPRKTIRILTLDTARYSGSLCGIKVMRQRAIRFSPPTRQSVRSNSKRETEDPRKLVSSKINRMLCVSAFSTRQKAADRRPRLFSIAFFVLQLSEILDGSDHLAGVAVLVVIPGNNLNLCCSVVKWHNHCLCCIEQ